MAKRVDIAMGNDQHLGLDPRGATRVPGQKILWILVAVTGLALCLLDFNAAAADDTKTRPSGSGVRVSSLSKTQIANVALLGRVWGFLKYHHPRVAAGELAWDDELFRLLPEILTADTQGNRRILARWVAQVGVPEGCDPCAQPPRNTHLAPPLDWISDADLLGPDLAQSLQQIHRYRFAGDEPFYVTLAPNVANPLFTNEKAYPELRPPDAGYRLLALLRLWNIIEYWSPYRDLLDEDWRTVLHEFLPRLVAADDWDTYRLELLAFIVHIRDTHSDLRQAFDVRPPRGACRWPVALRFIEGRLTVTTLLGGKKSPRSGLELGDVIATIDGRPVAELIAAWTPYYAGSNPAVRQRALARFMLRGACGESRLGIERRGAPRTIDGQRLDGVEQKPPPQDRPGRTFQRLSRDVAYLKLSTIHQHEIGRYLEVAAGLPNLVIDLRGYPNKFVVFSLGNRLVERPTPFVRFTRGDLDNPGAFSWSEPTALQPMGETYRGKVAILVDASTISQAEYTAMALRSNPRAIVVGSTTAGADGNVSTVPLPGGLQMWISGIGVFYPDKRPTQRVGIVPDLYVEPKIAGMRQGRDEVLEAALRHLLGPEADEEAIRTMAYR